MRLLIAAVISLGMSACLISARAEEVSKVLGVSLPDCTSIPVADTLFGSLGTDVNCNRHADSARPASIQAQIINTDQNGNWTLTWAKAFSSVTPYINAQAINTGAQPYICNVSASTATTASGRCWQIVTMTLPNLATSLLGLVLNPSAAASSIQVRVAARDTTQ